MSLPSVSILVYCTEYPGLSDVGAGRGTSYAEVVGGVELVRRIKTYQNLEGLGEATVHHIYVYYWNVMLCTLDSSSPLREAPSWDWPMVLL